ncbi:MAG TPA: hypothetical protein PLE12_11200 [Propionicimonas sp.]|jgi:hypothetical protein|nr:hypothetical protein [Propionicimonas sp.]
MQRPTQAEIQHLHSAVIDRWRTAVFEAGSLGLPDRVVVMRHIQAVAGRLADLEGLVPGQAIAAAEARAISQSAASADPTRVVKAWLGIGAAVLGFFGLLAWTAISPVLERLLSGAEEAGQGIGLALAVVPVGALVLLVRSAAQGIAAWANGRGSTPSRSQQILATNRGVEKAAFAAFGVEPPTWSLQPGEIVALLVGCVLAGLLLGAVASGLFQL